MQLGVLIEVEWGGSYDRKRGRHSFAVLRRVIRAGLKDFGMTDSWNTIATTHSVDETKAIAVKLASLLGAGSVVTLDGDLGAGKTHFTQGLAQGLGITEPITSPTFNLLCVYEGTSLPLYHFDVYRLHDARELDDIGFFECLESQGVSCVEWASKFEEEMPDNCIEVMLSRLDDDETGRIIRARAENSEGQRIIAEWIDKVAQ